MTNDNKELPTDEEKFCYVAVFESDNYVQPALTLDPTRTFADEGLAFLELRKLGVVERMDESNSNVIAVSYTLDGRWLLQKIKLETTPST